MSAYNYQVFDNVPHASQYLSNIKMVAENNGWTTDLDDINNTNELYLHSNGTFGNQSLYFSFKVKTAAEDDTGQNMQYIVWHCNQGFDSASAWDAQPGKISYYPYNAYRSGGAVFYHDPGHDQDHYNDVAIWINSPCIRQIVFANSQTVFSVHRVIQTMGYELSDQGVDIFVGYSALVFGAMDSLTPDIETELNFSLSSPWSMHTLYTSLFAPTLTYSSNNQWTNGTIYPSAFLYNGESAFAEVSDGFDRIFYSSIGANASIGYFSTWNCTCAVPPQKCPDYSDMLINNPGMARTILHKPFIYVEDARDSQDYHYLYPTRASLPYYACGFYPYLQPEQIISYGSRSFMVFPFVRDKDSMGYAIEINT